MSDSALLTSSSTLAIAFAFSSGVKFGLASIAALVSSLSFSSLFKASSWAALRISSLYAISASSIAAVMASASSVLLIFSIAASLVALMSSKCACLSSSDKFGLLLTFSNASNALFSTSAFASALSFALSIAFLPASFVLSKAISPSVLAVLISKTVVGFSIFSLASAALLSKSFKASPATAVTAALAACFCSSLKEMLLSISAIATSRFASSSLITSANLSSIAFLASI
ncbi:Uncharacterised protein [Streptococcus suis]|nr:Uncharacterised protein [Streptococcus suis]